MLPFLPPPTRYRILLKQGIAPGHEVWALQVLLNQLTSGPTKVKEDGVFGQLTEDKVVGLQRTERIDDDGIAGIVTQHRLAKRAAGKVTGLPPGLLLGIMAGESGYAIGATNQRVAGGIDAGLMQERLLYAEYSDAAFRAAFGFDSVVKAGALLRRQHDYFYGRPGCKTHQRAWEVATGSHNWPAAAAHVAAGDFGQWVYTAKDANGEKRQYHVDDDAWWVYRWGIPGVRTGREWFERYIDDKTALVTSWTA